MSQESMEVVSRGIDAWNRGDRDDELLAAFAPDVEWHTTGLFVDERVYRGRAGLERFWAELREDIEELTVSISEIRATGNRVFAAVTIQGRGKRSQAGFKEPTWYVATLRDRLILRVVTYLDPSEALEAAGLRE